MSRNKILQLNVIVNSDDPLQDIGFVVLNCVRQDLKVREIEFKWALLSQGLGYAFDGPCLYLIGLDGHELTEEKISNSLTGRIRVNPLTFRHEIINDFADDNLWFRLAVPIIRDSLKLTLKTRIQDQRDMLLRDMAIFNKKAEATYSMTANVLYGISFKDFVRIDVVRLGLCPLGRLEVFDTSRRIVEDSTLRHKLLTKAYWQYDRIHRLNFERMMTSILPFTIHFGDKCLTFEHRFLEISLPKEVAPQKTSSEETLDNWF